MIDLSLHLMKMRVENLSENLKYNAISNILEKLKSPTVNKIYVDDDIDFLENHQKKELIKEKEILRKKMKAKKMDCES